MKTGTVKDGTVKAGIVKDGIVNAGIVKAGTVKDGTVKVGLPRLTRALPSWLSVLDGRGEYSFGEAIRRRIEKWMPRSQIWMLERDYKNVWREAKCGAEGNLEKEQEVQKCIDNFPHLLAQALNKRQLQINWKASQHTNHDDFDHRTSNAWKQIFVRELRIRSGNARKVYHLIVTLIFKLIAFSFFNNSDYSDITILFGTIEIEIPAHRIILAHQSSYIHNDLVKNPKSGRLQLIQPAWSAHSFWRVFQYMYEKRYSLWPAEALRGIGRSPN